MDRKIEVNVKASYLTKDSGTAGVQHEGNAKVLRMIFDACWDEYTKTVTFWNAKGENPVKRILTADLLEDMAASLRIYLVPIPPEAMTEAGYNRFVIDGWADGEMTVRMRSVGAELEVEEAPFEPNAGESMDPTPTQAEQLQVQIDRLLATMQEIIGGDYLLQEDLEKAVAGKVDRAGDTMTGDLLIQKVLPALVQIVAGTTAFAKVLKNASAENDYGTQVVDGVDEDDYTRLVIGHKDNKLAVERVEGGGLKSSYDLYHEGNKPDGLENGGSLLNLNGGTLEEALNMNISGVNYAVFGQHNKPRGQYTGNGSAAARVIDTKGKGNVCVVTSNDGIMALVTGSGMFYGSGTTNPVIKSADVAKFEAGVLTINTTAYINAPNVIFTYQVL